MEVSKRTVAPRPLSRRPTRGACTQAMNGPTRPPSSLTSPAALQAVPHGPSGIVGIVAAEIGKAAHRHGVTAVSGPAGAATNPAPRAGTARTARRIAGVGPAPRGSGRRRTRPRPRGRGVEQEAELAQQQRLAGDGGESRQVHRIADVAVEPADHQPLGRGDRRRRAQALHDEPHERLGQLERPRDQQRAAHDAHRRPVRQRVLDPPPGQQPGDEPHDDARR
jgi:hypothetical protein